MALHIETPLLESLPLSARLGKEVWLKMEALQPSGSFKTRGIGHACSVYRERGAQRFICSSGGNAGLAAAYAGRRLGVPVLVVVPETTSARAKALIEQEGGQVLVHGRSWQEANDFALAQLGSSDAYIHPFDDPLLWEGHATLVDELASSGMQPDAIVLSVGGGGLLCGVIEGLHRNGWSEVPVVAVETLGADSLSQALRAGERVTLPAISSIATSLGARQVAEAALLRAQQHKVESVVVTDAAAVAGCFTLLEEHRVVVEPACGASIAALNAGSAVLAAAGRILVVVCGGVGASLAQLNAWRGS
ncbi:pyridoxal-phosphate dependent enzyme [Chitinimonas sp.]|uniref:pyridoxal-phosphate dependent enzyme n=1 Tax=Chitinimonas sp. TaxID=1934313 RepID=UPI002F95A741